MINARSFVVFFFSFAFSASVAFAQAEWKLFKEKDSIQVYFRESPNSNIKELMIRTWFEAPLASAVTLINDVENFDEWQDLCSDVKKLEVHSPTSYIFYNLADFPWPLTDREFIMKAEMKQDPVTHTVIFRSESVPDYLPPNEKYIRVPESISPWKIKPVKKTYLELEYYLKSDPGGSVPAWVVNLALQSGPFKTIKRLKALAQSEEYRNVKLSYITVPGRVLVSAE